jgi:tRNA A37 threonylcarbamoyltransferase TsaD
MYGQGAQSITSQTQLLAYADDIDIVGRTLRAVSEALDKMEKAASPMGLKVNGENKMYGCNKQGKKNEEPGQEPHNT